MNIKHNRILLYFNYELSADIIKEAFTNFNKTRFLTFDFKPQCLDASISYLDHDYFIKIDNINTNQINCICSCTTKRCIHSALALIKFNNMYYPNSIVTEPIIAQKKHFSKKAEKKTIKDKMKDLQKTNDEKNKTQAKIIIEKKKKILSHFGLTEKENEEKLIDFTIYQDNVNYVAKQHVHELKLFEHNYKIELEHLYFKDSTKKQNETHQFAFFHRTQNDLYCTPVVIVQNKKNEKWYDATSIRDLKALSIDVLQYNAIQSFKHAFEIDKKFNIDEKQIHAFDTFHKLKQFKIDVQLIPHYFIDKGVELINKATPLVLANDGFTIYLELIDRNKLIDYEFFIKIADESIPATKFKEFNNKYLIYKECIYFPKTYHDLLILYYFNIKTLLQVNKIQFFRFPATFINYLKEIIPIYYSNFKPKIIKVKNDEIQLSISLRVNDENLYFLTEIKNNQFSFPLFTKNYFTIENEILYQVELDQEFLLESQLNFLSLFNREDLDETNFTFNLNELLQSGTLFNIFYKAQELGFSIINSDPKGNFRFNTERAKLIVESSSKPDWFDLNIIVSFGKQTVSFLDLKECILNAINYILLADGSYGFIPQDIHQQLRPLFNMAKIEKNSFKIAKFQFSLLDILHDKINNKDLLKELEDKKNRLNSFSKIKNHSVPKEINASLRDYQKAALNWLNFLDEFNWGGILADDMGLGKTLEIISFIQSIKNKNKAARFLIVLPRSLIFNWQDELEKFAPNLTAYVHYGSNRKKELSVFNKCDISLISYGTLNNDIEILRKINFTYIILDEAQAIKNIQSDRYKAVCLLQAKNRICMTGTPIENSVMDLYSQLNFCNPGILGNISYFKNAFAKEIDKNGNLAQINILKKITHPFILRRTKEDVAKDLPEKTETVLFCEMSEAQDIVYKKFRDQYRSAIITGIERDGFEKSSFIILEGLLRLRQICDSARLVDSQFSDSSHSCKLNILLEHLEQIIPNHKVLIFSQFLGMLEQIKQELHRRDFAYSYLDGKTVDRKSVIEEFKSSLTKNIFLISLKTGGVGLNLTEADYVFMVDPWWNPAVTAQAIDRTHRIGQTKPVFAYKMIVKNSIEEKILKLQEKKLKLSKDLISSETSFFKSLEKKDILALFDN